MSRVYFHSPSAEAELLGSERGWLRHLAAGLAMAAWDLDDANGFERACAVVEMVPEVPDGEFGSNYLHTYWREALAQDVINKAYYQASPWPPATGSADHQLARRFVQALKLKLNVDGLKLDIAGVRLHSSNIDLNTALVAGSDPVRLAAKIHGWSESHCWVDGPNRAWLAGIVDEGLIKGLYRQGAGWDEIKAMLVTRDDEPVVMSFSVCESFPNQYVGGWMPPWPEGVPEDYNALSAQQKAERDERQDAWYDLESGEQWRIAFEALSTQKPWLQLTPKSLAGTTFSHPVTVYDLFATDRDERIRAAVDPEPEL